MSRPEWLPLALFSVALLLASSAGCGRSPSKPRRLYLMDLGLAVEMKGATLETKLVQRKNVRYWVVPMGPETEFCIQKIPWPEAGSLDVTTAPDFVKTLNAKKECLSNA